MAPWLFLVGATAFTGLAVRRWLDGRRVRRRLQRAGSADGAGSAPLRAGPRTGIAGPRTGMLRSRSSAAPTLSLQAAGDDKADSRLGHWLATAGHDHPNDRLRFGFAAIAALLAGALVALTVEASGLMDRATLWLEEIPGGVAGIFVPVIRIAPWLIALLIAMLPIVWVRRLRRARQHQVERDLPYVLSLLATLVESGQGFDAAAMRVERALGPERILSTEFKRVRAVTLAGASRGRGIRDMARRLDVPSLTAFSSALLHAENQGASIGETLRRQATDLWSRRREEAIQRAQTLPTRLAFPLVICFLPGVFVWTFGPAVAEFLRLAGSALPGNLN